MEDLVKEKTLKVTVRTINKSQGEHLINTVSVEYHHYYTVGSEFDFVFFSTVRSMPHQIIKSKAAVQADRAWTSSLTIIKSV